MKIKLTAIFILLFSPLSILSAQSYDILKFYNGHFEKEMICWRLIESPTNFGSTAEIITNNVYEGTKAAKLTFTPNDGTIEERIFETKIPIHNGEKYVAVVMAKKLAGNNFKLLMTFDFIDNRQKLISQKSIDCILTKDYKQYKIAAKAPDNAVFCRLGFQLKNNKSNNGGSGTIILDNARILTDIDSLHAFKPKVMPLTLPSDDIPIASVNITEAPYYAKNDGSKDVTEIFQDAINDAVAVGGAVIFMPAGHYRFDGSLLLREKVILRGEWINPEENNGKVEGTILDVYGGRGKEDGIPFLSIERGSGVKNMSFWYPEQTIQENNQYSTRNDQCSNEIPLNPPLEKGYLNSPPVLGGTSRVIPRGEKPKGWGDSHCSKNPSIHQSNPCVIPYPWTIHCNPKTGVGNNTSIINVTFVNPYQAINIGPEWNELHYIKNVYGTPLKKGVKMDFTTDIGRIYNLHFGPKYWSKSGLKSSPEDACIKNWLQKNATGIEIGRSDWEYMYDVSIDSYKIGVHILKTKRGSPNGAIYGLNVSNAEIGVMIDDVESIGYLITKSNISASYGNKPYCVYAGTNFKSIVQFNSCTFSGQPAEIIHSDGLISSHLTFQNCVFKSRRNDDKKNADINIKRGTIAVLDSVFENNSLNFNLGKEVICAQILDNKYPGNKPNIQNNSKNEIYISQIPLHCEKLNVENYVYPQEPKPNTNSLYVVTDFGAKRDGMTDDTKAIQKALDYAGKNGGGTVYLPAGHYKILTHLIVPKGVEMRGIWDIPHHTVSHGTVLFAYEGKNNENATPFISIETGAGIRGFTVWYPEQSVESIYAYPWSIRTKGTNCWIKDVALANTFKGADLASFPSAGHYVSYLCGAPLNTGIFISKNSGNGWVESLQFNPHYWGRNPDYPQPTLPVMSTIWEYQRAHLEAFKFGYCENEFNLGLFVYASLKGMYFVDDNGGCNSDIFLPGVDTGRNSIFIEKAGKGKGLNFINNQLVVAGKTIDAAIKTTPEFEGKAAFFNTLVWGDYRADVTKINGGGKIVIQQLHSTMGDFIINAGSSVLRNVVLEPRHKKKPKFIFGSKVKKASLMAVYSKEGTIIQNKAGNKLKAEYNYVMEKSTKIKIKSLKKSNAPLPPQENLKQLHTISRETALEPNRDKKGDLLPHHSYSQLIQRGMDFILNEQNNWFKGKLLPDGKGGKFPPYFSYASCSSKGVPEVPDVYPAFHNAIFINTFLDYYRYKGNKESLARAVQLADWNIDNSTPASGEYPNLPYSTYIQGKPGGSVDGESTMTDKAAILGLAYLRVYEVTQSNKYLVAAQKIANTLQKHIRKDGSLPFRVNPITGEVVEEYTSSQIYAVKLFCKLDEISRTKKYAASSEKVFNWILNGPVKNMNWNGFYEDVGNKPDNRGNWDCIDTAIYLINKDKVKYKKVVEKLYTWLEKNFSSTNHYYYPAEGFNEQFVCYTIMGVHTLHWANLLANMHNAYKENSFKYRIEQMLNFVTYMQEENNRIIVGPWFDPFWYSCHLGALYLTFDIFGEMPELAPSNENHILKTSGEVRDVKYTDTEISYLNNKSGIDILKLKYIPLSISVNGKTLSKENIKINKENKIVKFFHQKGLIKIVK